MVTPLGRVGNRVFAAILLGKLFQIHAVLEFEVISDPVIRIIIAVRIHGDTVRCQENAAAGLGIRDCSRAASLIVLVAAININ